MVGHGQGSNHDPECMAILRLPYILHLADIVTVQRHVKGCNHRKLFAQKNEERQRYLRRELTTIERNAHPTYVSRSFPEGCGSSIDECD